ncbi:hypothetical protein PR048_027441 [Dryococelus australis]|uniref:Uncharacterized protein n=1 Tax=Dryococelus australis TaxID=614101 RepID=A0ABQ9GGG3_9NEOP|nr:hypothetical protein PR048_027441 [Dryococelus australis]
MLQNVNDEESTAVSLLASYQGDPGSIPGRVTPYFRMWESYWMIPSVGGFSRGSPVSPSLHTDTSPYSPQSPTSALKTTIAGVQGWRKRDIPEIQHFFHLRKSRVTRLGIEPSSPRWRGRANRHWRRPAGDDAGRGSMIAEEVLRIRNSSSWYSVLSPICGFHEHRLARTEERPYLGPRSPILASAAQDYPHSVASCRLAFLVLLCSAEPTTQCKESRPARYLTHCAVIAHDGDLPGRQIPPSVAELARNNFNRRSGSNDAANCINRSRGAEVIYFTRTQFALVCLNRREVDDASCSLTQLGRFISTHPTPPHSDRVRFPPGSLPEFRMWESCRTMPVVDGFSRGSPVCPSSSFRRSSILNSITRTGSQYHAVKSRPNLFTHSLQTVRALVLWFQHVPGLCSHFAGACGWIYPYKWLFHLCTVRHSVAVLGLLELWPRSTKGIQWSDREVGNFGSSWRKLNSGAASRRAAVSNYRRFCADAIKCCASTLGLDPGDANATISRRPALITPAPTSPLGRPPPPAARRPAASSGTMATYQHPRMTWPGIEPGSLWWDASRLTASRMSMARNQHANNRIALEYTPGCSYVGNVPDDAVGPRVFSGFSNLLRPFIPALKTSLSSRIRRGLSAELYIYI